MDGEGITEHHYEFIGTWVTIARRRASGCCASLRSEPQAVQATACEQWAISLSLDNLMSFPWIRERVEAGTLALHGWYFDIDAGELLGYSPQTSSFVPLVPKPAATLIPLIRRRAVNVVDDQGRKWSPGRAQFEPELIF